LPPLLVRDAPITPMTTFSFAPATAMDESAVDAMAAAEVVRMKWRREMELPLLIMKTLCALGES
jgi:hypothetical protein